MLVNRLSTDEWCERTNNGIEISNPTWDQVRNAILSLDGKRKTVVTLSDCHCEGKYMIVAGQWDKKYMVNATSDNIDFFSLVDPARSKSKLLLYVGGQTGDYEERKCVLASSAIEAAEEFYRTGNLKNGMNWESDY